MEKSKIKKANTKKIKVNKGTENPEKQIDANKFAGVYRGLAKLHNNIKNVAYGLNNRISVLGRSHVELEKTEQDHYIELKNDYTMLRDEVTTIAQAVQNGYQDLDDKVDVVVLTTDSRFEDIQAEYVGLFAQAGENLKEAKETLEAQISGVDEILKNALAENMLELNDKMDNLEQTITQSGEEYNEFIEQDYKQLKNYVSDLEKRTSTIERTDAKAILSEMASINTYMKMTANKISVGDSIDLRRRVYKIKPIDRKTVTMYDGDEEIGNLISNPSKVYENLKIELPGEDSNIGTVDFIYQTKEEVKHRIPMKVEKIETGDNKTRLTIGRYTIPDNTEKMGLGVSSYNLN